MRRLLLLATAGVAVVAAAFSITKTVESFWKPDFLATVTADGIRIDDAPQDSSAHKAGLLPGDLITHIEGKPIASLHNPVLALLKGGRKDLVVASPARQMRRIVYYTPPPPTPDLLYLFRTAVAVLGLGFALFAFQKERSTVSALLVLAASASLVVAAVPHRTAASHKLLAVVHRAGGSSVGYLLFRFFWAFPEGKKFKKVWDLVAAAFVAIVASTAVVPYGDKLWRSVAVVLRAMFVLGLLGSGVIQLAKWKAAARVAATRRQVEWAALAMAVGLAPYVGLVTIPRLLGIEVEAFSWAAVPFMAAIPAGLVAAITKWRLWDLESFARESLMATAMVVAVGITYALLRSFVSAQVNRLGGAAITVSFAVGMGLVLLLVWLREKLGGYLDRWLYHGHPAPRRLITHSARNLALASEATDIAKRLTQALSEGLELLPVVVYVRSTSGFHPAAVCPDQVEAPGSLPEDVVDQQFPSRQERILIDSGVEHRIVLSRGGRTYGVLYVGKRRGFIPLGKEALQVVEAFAAQAAVGLESATLVEDLREKAEQYRVLHANTRRIIESSAAGILVCDAKGKVESANGKACTILGLPKQELERMNLQELLELPAHWSSSLPAKSDQIEVVTKTGEIPKKVVVSISLLEQEPGRFEGRVVVLQDVTELRELQDRLKEQERLASLGRLSSALAHELNTPLAAIASYAQMLASRLPSESEEHKLASKLELQCFRLSRLASNLLQLVRGGAHVELPVDLAKVVRSVSLRVRDESGSDAITKLQLPDKPILVKGDENVLGLLVANIVRNAYEASGSGGTVTISLEDRGETARLVVSDTGPGIPQKLREKIFKPFFTTRQATGGTGLGLTIARDVVKQLGGEIIVSEAPGGGALVCVELPKMAEQPAACSS